MSLNIGNKTFRNIQEQVAFNSDCIIKIAEAIDGIDLEDKLVTITSDTGSFTEKELAILSAPLAFISNGSRVWIKDGETLSEFVYKAIDIKATEVGSAYFEIGGSKIVVNRATGVYNTLADLIITTYSKSQLDSIVANIMAVKADKSELTTGLALKANIAGQTFTGEIKAPSIIQTMTGFSVDISSVDPDVTKNDIFVSAVQTGNKLTFVWYGSLIFKTEAVVTSAQPILVKFNIPSAVGAKLQPTSIAGYSYLDNRVIGAFSSAYGYKQIACVCRKNSNTQIYMGTYLHQDNITKGTEYFVRYELTFLLSDNFAS